MYLKVPGFVIVREHVRWELLGLPTEMNARIGIHGLRSLSGYTYVCFHFPCRCGVLVLPPRKKHELERQPFETVYGGFGEISGCFPI